MTFSKMGRVCAYLSRCLIHGEVHTTSGGELAFTPTGQIDQNRHAQMMRWGFVFVDGSYIYRPLKRQEG